MNMRPRHDRIAGQHGGAVVEFALMLTLLISIIAGIVEFGRTFWYYDALSKATRNAARTLAVSNPATISTGVTAAKTEVAAAAASAGVPNFDTTYVTVTCLDNNLITASCTDGVSPGGVRISVDGYQVFLGTAIPFLVGASSYTINLRPATTMPYMR
ncbi:MAG: TadE/TadG family type IV pilus assembly protein [Pseudomonadota bacterium]